MPNSPSVRIRPEDVLYRSVESMYLRETPREPDKKFWAVTLPAPGDGKDKTIRMPENEPLEIFVSNKNESPPVRIHCKWEPENMRSVWTIGHHGHNTPMVRMIPRNGMVVVGEVYEEGVQARNGHSAPGLPPAPGQGLPVLVARDVIELLGEVREFVDSCQDASKRQKWITMLKPRIEALQYLAKRS